MESTNIGENIRTLRHLRGMSLSELGEAAGVSRQTVQRYESGVISNIPAERVEAMAAALGTTPAQLLGWAEKRPPAVTLPCPEWTEADARALECGETLTIPRGALTDAADYCWRIPDDSAAPEAAAGDFAVIRAENRVPDGAMALTAALGKTMLRRVYRTQDGLFVLVAANPAYPPLVYSAPDGFAVLGRVLAYQVAAK